MGPLDEATVWLSRDMERTHIKGYVETGWGREVANMYKGKVEQHGAYYLHVASPPKKGIAGKGAALLINRACTTPREGEGMVYAHPQGKAVAALHTIRGTPTLILALHAPHTEQHQVRFFKDTAEQVNAGLDRVRTMHQGGWDNLALIIMGDMNYVADARADCVPPNKTRERTEAEGALPAQDGWRPH